MALDFENEQYVKVYKRDTVTLMLLSWQARALLWEFLRRCDRSGVIDVGGHGSRGLAAVVLMPCDVVATALPELVESGTIIAGNGCYVMPRFMEAQEARQSDAQRQRESRGRKRSQAINSSQSHAVTVSHTLSQNVTGGDNTSHAVTVSHNLSLLEENRLEQKREKRRNRELALAPSAVADAKKAKAKTASREVSAVLAVLSQHSGVVYRGARAHQMLIAARLRDGYTLDTLRKIPAYCAIEKGWRDDPKMAEFLRPETLYGATTIAKYADAANAWYRANHGDKALRPISEVLGETQPTHEVIQ